MKTMQLWSISVQSPCINVDGDDETLDDQSIDWSPSENGKEIDGTKIELGRDLSLSLSLPNCLTCLVSRRASSTSFSDMTVT